MKIPVYLIGNHTRHRTLEGSTENSILSCGFPVKSEARSDRDLCFPHCGGLLVLRGRGLYADHEGRCIPLRAGSFIQRIPKVWHSALV